MNWTVEKPTQPGWYWFKGMIEFPFDDHAGEKKYEYEEQVVNVWTANEKGEIDKAQIVSEDFILDISGFDGLWAGPLAPPEEEAVTQ